MFSKLLVGWGLLALCVVIHATGLAYAMRWFRVRSTLSRHFWLATWWFVRLAGWIVLLHLLEITTWAVFYVWKDAMVDLPASLYFSAVTYTTTGYGDLVLPPEWRLVGAIEALTGILMCGWSTGFFFAVVARMFRADINTGNS
jgi:voltage-gated potassium channel Kch